MNNSCLIKSFPNGIVLHLDPEKPFADLLIDIAEKFSESRAFFKDDFSLEPGAYAFTGSLIGLGKLKIALSIVSLIY